MKGLAITGDNLKNQQEVVKNEVQVNVLNQPYGGFPWLDLPQYANTNWYNAHNFYGDLKDLDAATLEDVPQFFKTYYAPNNAVLVVVGDFDPGRRPTRGSRSTSPRSRASKLPPKPDISEPRQEKEKRATKADALADAARARHRLPRAAAQHARVLRDRAARPDPRPGQGQPALPGARPEERADRRRRGRHQLGPRRHVQHQRPDALGRLALLRQGQDVRPDPGGLRRRDREACGRRPSTRRRSTARWSRCVRISTTRSSRPAASAAPICSRPSRCSTTTRRAINQLEAEFRKVTPALIQKTAQEYLRPENRTILAHRAEGRAQGRRRRADRRHRREP